MCILYTCVLWVVLCVVFRLPQKPLTENYTQCTGIMHGVDEMRKRREKKRETTNETFVINESPAGKLCVLTWNWQTQMTKAHGAQSSEKNSHNNSNKNWPMKKQAFTQMNEWMNERPNERGKKLIETGNGTLAEQVLSHNKFFPKSKIDGRAEAQEKEKKITRMKPVISFCLFFSFK